MGSSAKIFWRSGLENALIYVKLALNVFFFNFSWSFISFKSMYALQLNYSVFVTFSDSQVRFDMKLLWFQASDFWKEYWTWSWLELMHSFQGVFAIFARCRVSKSQSDQPCCLLWTPGCHHTVTLHVDCNLKPSEHSPIPKSPCQPSSSRSWKRMPSQKRVRHAKWVDRQWFVVIRRTTTSGNRQKSTPATCLIDSATKFTIQSFFFRYALLRCFLNQLPMGT